jgi:hypothetical protein
MVAILGAVSAVAFLYNFQIRTFTRSCCTTLYKALKCVKGWLDAKGDLQEKVYDVVWSGNRKPGSDGKLPPVGNTVDMKTATYSNTIGAPELTTTWKDPDFDASLKPFSYIRVLEIPTPRWTLYDVVRFGITMDPKVPMVEQQRAYTSPIWYTPGK